VGFREPSVTRRHKVRNPCYSRSPTAYGWSRFASPARLRTRGAETELLHHPESVPHVPALDDASTRDAVDPDPHDPHALAGRGDAVQIAVVRALADPTRHDRVALGSAHLFDRPPRVAEGGLVSGDERLHSFWSCGHLGMGRIVVGVARGEEIVRK